MKHGSTVFLSISENPSHPFFAWFFICCSTIVRAMVCWRKSGWSFTPFQKIAASAVVQRPDRQAWSFSDELRHCANRRVSFSSLYRRKIRSGIAFRLRRTICGSQHSYLAHTGTAWEIRRGFNWYGPVFLLPEDLEKYGWLYRSGPLQ